MEEKQPAEHRRDVRAVVKKSKGDQRREERQRKQLLEVLTRLQMALVTEGALDEVSEDFHPISIYIRQADPTFKITDL